jgi:hypothetical protein
MERDKISIEKASYITSILMVLLGDLEIPVDKKI